MQKQPFTFKTILFIEIISFVCSETRGQEKSYQLFSPDRKTEVRLQCKDKIYFSIAHNGREMLAAAAISLSAGRRLGRAIGEG